MDHVASQTILHIIHWQCISGWPENILKKHLINGWSEGIEATPNYCILIIPCVGFGLLRGQKKATNLNQGHERTHCNGSSAVMGAMASENKVRTATVAQVLHRRAKAAPK